MINLLIIYLNKLKFGSLAFKKRKKKENKVI